MNIEIITSSNAKLKETGFGSPLACNDVLTALKLTGHAVIVTVCQTLADLQAVLVRKPDLVVLAAKYMPVADESDVWFSEYFENNNITFSGSGRETLKFDSDKVSAKNHLANLGIKTAKHFTAIPEQHQLEADLPFSFPLFLKPMDAANGNGIDDDSFVENFSEFKAKVLSLYQIYQQPVLVEEYLAGREFTVAVIKSGSGHVSISAIEIIPKVSTGGLRILGAVAKISDSELLKAVTHQELDAVKLLAGAAFKGLGVRGFGRIDVKMDALGECYFMEANLLPGMNNKTSYFPRACKIANQMEYGEVIRGMLDESLERVYINQELKRIFMQDILSEV